MTIVDYEFCCERIDEDSATDLQTNLTECFHWQDFYISNTPIRFFVQVCHVFHLLLCLELRLSAVVIGLDYIVKLAFRWNLFVFLRFGRRFRLSIVKIIRRKKKMFRRDRIRKSMSKENRLELAIDNVHIPAMFDL